jgi:putative transposase
MIKRERGYVYNFSYHIVWVTKYRKPVFTFKPKLAPADVVKILKGSSARLWFTAHPETKRKLWGGHLWSPSYYIGTLGEMSKQVVEEYINNQRTEKSNAGRPSKKSN